MVGREAEKAHLKSLLKSDEHEFVAVFGRRRIGKTYLVLESKVDGTAHFLIGGK